jgi:hypothetical protein
MTVVLTGSNRFTLFSVLPFHGNPLGLKLFEDFRDLIGFSEEEVASFPKIDDIKIEVGDYILKIIETELIRLKENGTITPEQDELYKIFIGK